MGRIGAINYQNGFPVSIGYACDVELGVTYYLDENLCVSAIRYVEPW